MNHILKLIIALSLIKFSFFISSMDKPQKIIVTKIDTISWPRHVTFLKDPNILIITDDENIYHIDWKNNRQTPIHKIPLAAPPIHCFSNLGKEILAVTTIDKVMLYSPNTRSIIWKNPKEYNIYLSSSALTCSNELYTMESNGVMHSSNTDEEYDLSADQSCKSTIICHPIEEKIFYTRDNKKPTQQAYELSTIHLNKKTIEISHQKLPITTLTYEKPYPKLYSPIEDIIAFYYPIDDSWSLYNIIDKKFILHLPDCSLLAFHPKKHLIAILTKNETIKIYDLKKNISIAEMNEPLVPPTKKYPLPITKCMDFSADGKYLAVIRKITCVILSNLYPENAQ